MDNACRQAGHVPWALESNRLLKRWHHFPETA